MRPLPLAAKVALLVLLLVVPWWVRTTFGEVSLDLLLFHWQLGLAGLVDSDRSVRLEAVTWIAGAPCGAALAVLLGAPLARRRQAGAGRGAAAAAGLARAVLTGPGYLIVLALTAMASGAWLGLGPYLLAPAADHALFEEGYVKPAPTPPPFAERRNLVIVYVESLEAGYGDAAAFGRDLLAGLGPDGARLGDFRQLAGTEFTLGGLAATQCGVPVHAMFMPDVNRQTEHLRRILPGARCLAQILGEVGYRTVFMQAASGRFAGMRQFLGEHGWREVMDREHWWRAGLPGNGVWGLDDDQLLEQAERVHQGLSAGGEPFLLALSTIDMHGPDGFLNEPCRRQGFQGFRGVVECTAGRVGAFVRKVRAMDGDRTRVVVLGDHLAWANPEYRVLQTTRRSVFAAIYGAGDRPFRQEVNHFDLFPTLVSLAGATGVQRLGLGFDAASVRARPPGWEERLAAANLRGTVGYRALWLQP